MPTEPGSWPTLEARARRLLARAGAGVYPYYHSVSDGQLPIWWSEFLPQPEWGPVFGVNELEPGDRRGALVVCENGLAVLDGAPPTWVAYADVERWDQLSKTPPSRELVLRLRGGRTARLRFLGGGAFEFVQYISAVLRTLAWRRRRAGTD